jgi:endonuclease/exonuclease/phosphatase family metal-dependent hydrolase
MALAALLRCSILLIAFAFVTAFELSVMSYNLYGWNALGTNRWKADNIFSKMREYAPDLMGCQEVENHAAWISSSTVDSSKGAFAVAAAHAGHAIFYRSQLFVVEAEGFFDIDEQDQWGLRRLAWARFRNKANGESFLHFNSHWCVCGEASLFSTARSVAQWIQSVRSQQDDLPAMLTGDFNVFANCENSKAIRYLKGETVAGHTSPVVFFDAHDGQGATFGGCKIDYVLLTGPWKVTRSIIDRDHRQGAIGSDHDSLYAQVVLDDGHVTPQPTDSPVGICELGGSVWEAFADGHSCGARIEWSAVNLDQGDVSAARKRVAEDYPRICGSCWNSPTAGTTSSISSTAVPTTPKPTICSRDGSDRWSPDFGGCCSALAECVEHRSKNDPYYCPANDPQHGSSCWSTILMCRSSCASPSTSASPVATTATPATPDPSICSLDGSDRWSPDLGGCCSELDECVEQRSTDDSYYCPANDPQHGSSCWSTILMCRSECVSHSTTVSPPQCQNLKNVERVCSADGCKVLATGMTDHTCQQYCAEQGLSCKAAWEEQNENCVEIEVLTCEQTWPGTSDLICECEPLRRLLALVMI